MATCVDITGAEYPARIEGTEIIPMQGESLMPAFMGLTESRIHPLFWEWRNGQAVRDGEWKLVREGLENEWELFNVTQDPTEINNLAEDLPGRVSEMDEQFRQWKASTKTE
jgi:arylsulfatase